MIRIVRDDPLVYGVNTLVPLKPRRATFQAHLKRAGCCFGRIQGRYLDSRNSESNSGAVIILKTLATAREASLCISVLSGRNHRQPFDSSRFDDSPFPACRIGTRAV